MHVEEFGLGESDTISVHVVQQQRACRTTTTIHSGIGFTNWASLSCAIYTVHSNGRISYAGTYSSAATACFPGT